MNLYHIPGLQASIFRDSAIIWTGAYGYADIQSNTRVSDSTLFHIASLSKPITATALMQLWEAGRFGLDEDINRYLPFPVRNPSHPNDSITFRMLLTHTSSIDDYWPTLNWLRTWGTDSPVRLDSFLVKYLVPGGSYWNNANYGTWAPLTSYHYSNVGATLLAYLVETLTNAPFDQYSRDSIFAPLGMNHTAWFLRDLDSSKIALPYYYSGGNFHSYGHYGVPFYPVAQLRTSASQLARFLIACKQMGRVGTVRILDSSTVALMTTVQFPALADFQGLIWGIYWYTIPGWGTYLACGHQGGFPGVNTVMEYMLETNRHMGIVVLTNGESSTGTLLIADALYAFGDTLSTDVANELRSVPEHFELSQNYPNPFNPATTIRYGLPRTSFVTLTVHNTLGQQVTQLVNEQQQAGYHDVAFHGEGLASGVYFCRMQAGAYAETKKLLLVK